jgi:iron(III) transport system substrate-binding protein
MNSRGRWARAAALGICVAVVATGCAAGGSPAPAETTDAAVDPDWQAVVDAANEEGNVVWYTVSPEASREDLKAAFEEKYPEISVEIIVLGMPDMTAALEAEHDTGADGADVATSVNFTWLAEKVEEPGWFAALEGPEVLNPEWQESGWVVDDTLIYSPLGLLVNGWNTQLFSGEITSYDDLLDPALAGGAIGVPDAAVHPLQADWYSFLETQTDADFVEDLAAQDPTIYPSARTMQEALFAGEIAVGTFVSASDLAAAKDDGVPVDYSVPDPAFGVPNVFLVPESAQNPNAAQVFMDFFLSEDGQRAAAAGGATPLTAVQPDTLGANSNVQLLDQEHVLDPAWFEEFIVDWNATFDR